MKILFVSHSSGRTGAPRVLAHFLRWLRQNTPVEFAILTRDEGPMVREFRELAETTVLCPGSAPRPRLIASLARRLGLQPPPRRPFPRLDPAKVSGIDLIYSNTLTNGLIVGELARPGCPVITHAHELESWIDQCGAENWSSVCRHTTRFVAASAAVASHLTSHRAIPAAQVEVVHEFIDAALPNGLPEARRRIRGILGIPEDAFVVGGSGAESWRKGKDLFVQAAVETHRRRLASPIFFVWVGATGDRFEHSRLCYDARAGGASDWMRWTGEVENPIEHFAAFDLLAMVSREDPFPLVCLEAALQGKPILCWTNAGGVPELVEDDAGFVVPYLDIGGLVDRIGRLAADRPLREGLGARAAAKVREKFTVETQGPRLLAIIEHEWRRHSRN